MKGINQHFQRALDEEDTTQAKVFLYYHKAKINLDKTDPLNEGKSLLHCFCERGSLSVVRLLVDNGASIELVDGFGNTGLHYACSGNYFELVRFLLNTCANVFATNEQGKIPSQMTTNQSVKILIEAAMSLNSKANQVMTLGRSRKSKTHQNNQLRRRESSRRCQNDVSNENTAAENNNNNNNNKVKKIPSFNKARRGSGTLGLFRIKKANSVTDRKSKSPRKSNMEAKWSDLQALRRTSSETDVCRDETEGEDVNEGTNAEKLNIQKVNNSEQLNLIGLSIA